MYAVLAVAATMGVAGAAAAAYVGADRKTSNLTVLLISTLKEIENYIYKKKIHLNTK